MAATPSRAAAPAFQAYADNELVDTLALSLEEIGAYWRLKLYAWSQGSIPASAAERARVMGAPEEMAADLWAVIAPYFVARPDGSFVHADLERQRQEHAAYSQTQSTKGAKGARARWEKTRAASADHGRGHASANATGIGDQMAGAMAEGCPDDSSSSFVLHQECVDKDHQHTSPAHGRQMARASLGYAPGFEAFWAAYPRRDAKMAAATEYARIAPGPALQAAILAGVHRACATAAWREVMRDDPERRRIPHARTWLHQRRWEDPIAAAPAPSMSSAPQLPAELATLLEAAGIARRDHVWFSTGMITRGDHASDVRVIIGDHDARAFVIKHFKDQLITAGQARGETVIIGDQSVAA